MINWKSNQGHEISQKYCKLSVHYHVYNNYKLSLGATAGWGSRKLKILKLLYQLTWNLHFAGIPL